MEREGHAADMASPAVGEMSSVWAAYIQQQIQAAFEAAIPHIVQQISERTVVSPAVESSMPIASALGRTSGRLDEYNGTGLDDKDSKVAAPDKFNGRRGGEVYKWFAQLRLVFRGKPRAYRSEEDKVAYALSYMAGAAQNWAMPILQALDEGRPHELLINYDSFRDAVIAVFGEIDRKGNAEDRLGKIKQTGSVATYISTFNEYAAQVDWNEASLVARFRGGLKDEVLDSIATAETQPHKLQEWMAMASRIDGRLWTRHQHRRPVTSVVVSKDHGARFQANPVNTGPVPMELDAISGTTALAKTAAERLEYQRQGRCWGCGQLGHIRAKCPTNPSKPFSIAAIGSENTSIEEWGKGQARD